MASPRVVSVDFETFYDKKAGYDISSLGAWKYCDDARFDPYLLAVSDGAESWAGRPQDFNWSSLDGAILVSHNKAFDAMVYEAMVRKGMAPRVNYAAWHCTANLASFLANRRSLRDAASFLLGITLSKDVRDYANGKSAEDIKRDGKWDEILAYGRSDAFHCWSLWNRYGALWPETERQLSEMTIAQGDRGVAVNTPLLDEFLVRATQALQKTEELLPWIAEGRPVTSPKAIAEECRKVGIPGPPIKSHEDGERLFAEWETAYGPKYPWVSGVSNYRSLKKLLGSLQTIKTRLRPDGTFPFSLLYFGAHTGRFSGSGSFNMQNLRREAIFIDDAGLMVADELRIKEIQAGNLTPAAALDIRKLFIARPGKKLIVSDLCQIEARILMWLVSDREMLDQMAAGMSIYEAYARKTFGWTGGSLKKENKELYFLSKCVVLGLGFGAGAEKFITIAKTLADVDVTSGDPAVVQKTEKDGTPVFDAEGKPVMISGRGTEARRIVKAYRNDNPGVVSLWKRLDEAFKASVGSSFELELPGGRSLRYGQVRRECRTVRDEETGVHKRKWVTSADVGGRRFVFWGGVFVENLCQSIARDCFVHQLAALDKTPGIRVLFSVHDEAVLECDPGISPKDVEKIMSVAPDWLPGCPIAAEAAEVPSYQK